MHKEQNTSVNMFSEIVAENASDVSILQNQPRSPVYVNATIDMASVTIKQSSLSELDNSKNEGSHGLTESLLDPQNKTADDAAFFYEPRS